MTFKQLGKNTKRKKIISYLHDINKVFHNAYYQFPEWNSISDKKDIYSVARKCYSKDGLVTQKGRVVRITFPPPFF